jgi:hypothetical protein
VVPQTTPTPDSGTYIFSPRELQRLAAYRAAVVARFYNDECDSVEPSPRLSPFGPATIRMGATRERQLS